jgi:hypothetical protein
LIESPGRRRIGFISARPATQRTAIKWAILIVAQMIIPQSAKLTCNASVIANLARILAIALLNGVIWS